MLSSCIHFNQIDIINHIQSDERFFSDLVGVFIHVGTESNGKGKEKANPMAMDVDKPAVNGNTTAITSSGGSTSISSTSHSSTNASAEDPLDKRKRDIILLLQQLCMMGKCVQLPARIGLFKTLVERGVLFAVQWALCQHDRPLVSIAGEILAVLLDHHTAGVRAHVGQQGHLLQQHPYNTTKDTIAHVEAQPSQQQQQQQQQTQQNADKQPSSNQARVPLSPSSLPFKESIMQVLCRMLADSQDLALQNQLADALRLVLEIPQFDVQGEPPVSSPKVFVCKHETSNVRNLQAMTPSKQPLRVLKDDQTVENFLENFYNVSVDTLFRPILNDVPEHQTLQGPREFLY